MKELPVGGFGPRRRASMFGFPVAGKTGSGAGKIGVTPILENKIKLLGYVVAFQTTCNQSKLERNLAGNLAKGFREMS